MKNRILLILFPLCAMLFSCEKNEIKSDEESFYKEKLESLMHLKKTSTIEKQGTKLDPPHMHLTFKTYKEAFEYFSSLRNNYENSLSIMDEKSYKAKKGNSKTSDETEIELQEDWDSDFYSTSFRNNFVYASTNVDNAFGLYVVLLTYSCSFRGDDRGQITQFQIASPHINISGPGTPSPNPPTILLTYESNWAEFNSVFNVIVTVSSTEFSGLMRVWGRIQPVLKTSPRSAKVVTSIAALAYD